MDNDSPLLLILRPTSRWAIVTAELRRVTSLGRYMDPGPTLRSHSTDGMPDALQQLATLCEELQPGALYTRYADKRVFRREQDFWATDDQHTRLYVRQMADQRLLQALRLASDSGLTVLYAPTPQSALHADERLLLQDGVEVMPVMSFDRTDSGIAYRLQLRIGGDLVGQLASHGLTVLGHNPGMFVLDRKIFVMGEGFSGKLLLPFVGKDVVEIPPKMVNDYFRRFILRNVTRAEVSATGFDIEDQQTPLTPRLKMGTALDGSYLLSLLFVYGSNEYAPDSRQNGRVMLSETPEGFCFTRQMRDKDGEQHYEALLRQVAPALTSAGYVGFSSIGDIVGWLQQHGEQLRQQGFDVVQPSDYSYYIGPLDVEQSDTWQGDWLQTRVTVVLDGGRLRLPFTDLVPAILRGEQEYMLPTGQRLLIPEEWLERYTTLMLTARRTDGCFSRHRSQTGGGADNTPRQHDAPPQPKPAVPSRLKACLRPYQQVGYEWLWYHFVMQTGCCLSDEMGLGKTLQVIALLLKYKETATAPAAAPQPGLLFTEAEMSGNDTTENHAGGERQALPHRTSLIVAPASVAHNWMSELARFAPSLTAMSYTGALTQRHDKQKALQRWDVVVTTYRTLLNDIGMIENVSFGIVVFDESQAFKTPSSQLHHAVDRLKGLHRVALSGTPVENNILELWSLMSILNPELLGSQKMFQQAFVGPIAQRMEKERAQVLRQLVRPYFLKRTKEEVLSDLPERQDEVVVCPMTERQASLYAEQLSQARNEWLDPQTADRHKQMHILAAIQRLRQTANGEGKMSVVFDRLEQLRSSRRAGEPKKVLIFSEYVTMLERVGQEMKRRGWSYDVLTGATQHREEVISHFQTDSKCQFFLISLKAGGVGINLTSADYVFILDPWWNLAAEEQAIARSHRIGQRRSVFVYRFVSENTLEQQILSLQERKQNIIDSVLPFMLK